MDFSIFGGLCDRNGEGMLPNEQGDIEAAQRVAFVGLSRAMHLLTLPVHGNIPAGMGRNPSASTRCDG